MLCKNKLKWLGVRSGLRSVVMLSCLLLLNLAVKSGSQSGHTHILVNSIDSNAIKFVCFERKEEKTTDLRDLTLCDDISSHAGDLTGYYDEVPDFKLLLLRKGLAKLKTSDTEPAEYVKAQEAAQNEQLGFWEPPPDTSPAVDTPEVPPGSSTEPPPDTPPIVDNPEVPTGPSALTELINTVTSWLAAVWEWIVNFWTWIVSLGLLSMILAWSSHWIYIKDVYTAQGNTHCDRPHNCWQDSIVQTAAG